VHGASGSIARTREWGSSGLKFAGGILIKTPGDPSESPLGQNPKFLIDNRPVSSAMTNGMKRVKLQMAASGDVDAG
jgi:hypothetical protein